MSCSIYYPGLLGPDVPLQELPRSEWPSGKELAALQQLFTTAERQALRRCSVEARMLYGMGFSLNADRDVPAAAIRAGQLVRPRAGKSLWCLDPVSIRIDQDQAVLLGNDTLNISEAEARALIADLNAHLQQDDLHIHYLSPQQWLLEGALDLTTATLSDAWLENINLYLPHGADERRWRRLLNEIQMLLHQHPVNTQRSELGAMPINSVWLWGGGDGFAYEQIINDVYSNESLVQDAALHYDIPCHPLPVNNSVMPAISGQVLFIVTDQIQHIKQRDVFGWLDNLRRFEQHLLAPLINLLKNNTLGVLTVYSDTLSLSVTNKQIHRWWRIKKSIDKTICLLRKQYGI